MKIAGKVVGSVSLVCGLILGTGALAAAGDVGHSRGTVLEAAPADPTEASLEDLVLSEPPPGASVGTCLLTPKEPGEKKTHGTQCTLPVSAAVAVANRAGTGKK